MLKLTFKQLTNLWKIQKKSNCFAPAGFKETWELRVVKLLKFHLTSFLYEEYDLNNT